MSANSCRKSGRPRPSLISHESRSSARWATGAQRREAHPLWVAVEALHPLPPGRCGLSPQAARKMTTLSA